MTMAQGGLFDGNEESTKLFTTASNGQSQSKEAKYHRAYRSDPKNKNRINSQKKRRRALKKESELGSVSSMFESVARPAKEEPQTVEQSARTSDKTSLPDSISGTSCELSDSSRNYCQSNHNSVANGRTGSSIKRKSSNFDKQNQAELLVELRDSFRGIESALETIQDMVKPATQLMPDSKEQKAIVSGIANSNGAKLAKKKTIANIFIEKLPIFGLSLLILTFLGFNTFFLVSEQVSLYESMSYSTGMALLIAILSEASLILLSSMASWVSNLEWKLWLTSGTVAMVVVMVGILDSSAKSRVNTAAKQSQEAKSIEKQIITLRALEAPILAQIKSLDPEVYPSKINRLSSKLTSRPDGYSYKIELFSKRLSSISIAEADTTKLIWQRRVSLMINLIMSSFLGFLWSRKQESLIQRVGRGMSGYLQRTCEV
ncbi:MAG: hypothetical protein AB8G05_22170 [Oligoflexales bacterium]